MNVSGFLEHHSILNLNFNKIQINSFSIKMNKILIVSLASLMLTSAAPSYDLKYYGTANLYNDGTHKLNFNGWAGNTKRFRRQFEYENFGGNFEYQHRNGHSLSLGSNVIPKLDQQTIDVTGNANIWRSDDKLTSLNAYGSASHNIGDFNKGHTDYKAGLTFDYTF
ncbi:hypothetical protein PVAND_010706 [Polypedilum vanderplanki]|uniref:Attacin C-terminal domain-containing protein n=1 Tax=Polypedilum vanderplanki TaxID=319348 RepID=A0A9J6CHA9_POLVA|nr:hypothetical protein PVAND_010706 [Polypedilum vanderplanki]